MIGTADLHTAIDDHSRVAYVEICSDKKAADAIAVLQRAYPSRRTAATALG